MNIPKGKVMHFQINPPTVLDFSTESFWKIMPRKKCNMSCESMGRAKLKNAPTELCRRAAAKLMTQGSISHKLAHRKAKHTFPEGMPLCPASLPWVHRINSWNSGKSNAPRKSKSFTSSTNNPSPCWNC